ncbi:hypothetical protein CSV77_15165 [Sporosarcina sp. P16b]|uniref:glycosyltransferase n=1 Tax=Sporosarcina sp. P16b TaxID=2048261 RepID=UPI000C16B516|nr:glycosyltransferase [Sporosarcina sp. P16b]PIC69189.1 hypothetical protein CSV77_15165 [Sporosarcina sp. P16b]
MKKKIIFIISNLNIGGPQKSLLALLDNFNYDLFDVTVYVLQNDGELKNYYNRNVEFIQVDDLVLAATIPSNNILKSFKTFINERKFGMLFDSFLAIFNNIILRKNMNQERQKFWRKHKKNLPKIDRDFDMAFGILGLSTYVALDLVRSKKKYHWIRSDTRILNRDIEIDGEYYQKIDGCISVSHECAKIFEEVYPFMKNKVKVLYNEIPLSFYRTLDFDKKLMKTEKKCIKIISVTRLDPLKGIEMAIEACKILLRKGYDIKWFILGDGSHRQEIEKEILNNGIEDSFILLGFQLNTLSFINEADIFVHPSRTEGKSNAVDEAKFVAKPIVVTNYDTVGEQIENNVTGLISGMSGEEVAETIESIIVSKELREKLINNCVLNQQQSTDINAFFETELI